MLVKEVNIPTRVEVIQENLRINLRGFTVIITVKVPVDKENIEVNTS